MVLATSLLLLVLACGRSDPAEDFAAVLDRLAASFLAPPLAGQGDWLLCSRFEITQAEFGLVAADAPSADLPVVMIDRAEAASWAAAHDMRLPTLLEWEHLRLAGGGEVPAARTYANTLELGLGRPLPVGVFERGRTPLGGYDFLGNVWEWTSDEDALAIDAPLATIVGGSFASYPATSTQRRMRRVDPHDRATDLGFRPVAEASRWIRAHLLPTWQSTDAAGRAQLSAALAPWRPEYRRQFAAAFGRQNSVSAGFLDFLSGVSRASD